MSEKSHVQKTLEALEALIEGKATKDQQSYSINGRTITKMPITDLLKWRDKYKAEFRKEQLAAEGKANNSTIKFYF